MFGGIEKLNSEKLFSYLIFFCSIIIPGVGLIYITNPILFFRIETLKLVLLSILYSLPIVLASTILVVAFSIINKEKRTKDFSYELTLIGVFSLFMFFLVFSLVVISPRFHINFLYSFYGILIILFSTVILFEYFSVKSKAKKLK